MGTMGILPVGSGCDFSWSVGVPADLEGAVALLARAQTRVVAVGWLTADGEMLCEGAHHIECEIAPYKVRVIC